TAFRYNASGTLTYVQGVGGLRASLVYDSSQRLSYIQSPTGGRTTYSYAAGTSASIRRIQDPAGRITTLTTSGSTLVKVIRPDGGRTTLGYSGSLLNQVTGPLGSTQFAYATGGLNLRRRMSALGQITSYSSATAQMVVQDPKAHRTTVAYDANNNVRRITDASGKITSYTWQSNVLQSVRQPNGARTTLAYTTISADNTQRLQSITLP